MSRDRQIVSPPLDILGGAAPERSLQQASFCADRACICYFEMFVKDVLPSIECSVNDVRDTSPVRKRLREGWSVVVFLI